MNVLGQHNLLVRSSIEMRALTLDRDTDSDVTCDSLKVVTQVTQLAPLFVFPIHCDSHAYYHISPRN